MRIGVHVSVAASLERAAEHAHAIGCSTLQIFTSSPRMWRRSRVDPGDVERFAAARRRFHLRPLVVHGNYLINLASAESAVRERSVAAFRKEILQASAVGADYLVMHPGSSRGQTPDRALARFAAAFGRAVQGLRPPVTVLLENTAGQGSSLGSDWRELKRLRDAAQQHADFPVAYCLDTAHAFAAGVDFFEAADGLGTGAVRVIHANDSKTARGSRVDRHEQIGKGFIGEDWFRTLVNHRRFRDTAFILETPVVEPDDDARNIALMRSLRHA